MDVSNLLKSNDRKTKPSGSWSAVLNRAAAPKTSTSQPFHGVAAPARTLENAKLADSTLEIARSTFAKALGNASDHRKSLSPDQQTKLEKSSSTLVNQFFMGSMLKQMRNSPFKNDMFSGGKGGEAYSGLFDQRLAEHSGNRIAKSLVNSMVKQYSKTAAGVAPAADVTGGAA
jgi:hypothetical protein